MGHFLKNITTKNKTKKRVTDLIEMKKLLAHMTMVQRWRSSITEYQKDKLATGDLKPLPKNTTKKLTRTTAKTNMMEMLTQCLNMITKSITNMEITGFQREKKEPTKFQP